MLPLTQGQLDGLCGIYSTINATRLITGLGPGQSLELFQRLFTAMGKRKTQTSLVKDGLSNRDLAYALGLIQGRYLIRRSRPFPKSKDVPLRVYWDRIASFLEGDGGKAVILVVEGCDWSHWTVVRRATAKTFILFDSDHLKRISRRRATTFRVSRNRPLLLHPTMTYFLWKDL